MRRLTLGLLITSTLSGCVAWRPQSVTPRELLDRGQLDVIRVATGDSPQGFPVYQPRIINDTLTGHPSETAISRVAVPVKDITQVSTRYRHIGKSFLAVIAVGTGVIIYGLLQTLNGSTP